MASPASSTTSKPLSLAARGGPPAPLQGRQPKPPQQGRRRRRRRRRRQRRGRSRGVAQLGGDGGRRPAALGGEGRREDHHHERYAAQEPEGRFPVCAFEHCCLVTASLPCNLFLKRLCVCQWGFRCGFLWWHVEIVVDSSSVRAFFPDAPPGPHFSPRRMMKRQMTALAQMQHATITGLESGLTSGT